MSISRFTLENFGSLILIEYAPLYSIASFSPGKAGTITAQGVQFYAGYGWQRLYCSEDTMGHKQSKQLDAGGEYWQQQVIGTVPGDELVIEQALLELKDQRFVVRTTNPNGIIKVVGNLKQPLSLSLDSDSQSTVPGTPGTDLTFSANTRQRALLQL